MKFSAAIIFISMICVMDVSAQRISDLPGAKSVQTSNQTSAKAQNTTTTVTPPPVKAAPPGTQDSIKFEKTTHDYGTMVQGADGNCEFKFTNNGKAPLVLSNVAASCGCTVPEWPKAPILPGQTGSIKVKYNTELVGVFNKSVTVHSNAVNGQAILQIKGNVTAKK